MNLQTTGSLVATLLSILLGHTLTANASEITASQLDSESDNLTTEQPQITKTTNNPITKIHTRRHEQLPTTLYLRSVPVVTFTAAEKITENSHTTPHPDKVALQLVNNLLARATNSASANKSMTGIASWYGPGFHGRRSASGERYNQNAMTAAHRSLPFGTMVRVTNTKNGRSVVVRINDRGPFIRGRVIDMSAAAARVLGMVQSGVAPVRIEVIGRQ